MLNDKNLLKPILIELQERLNNSKKFFYESSEIFDFLNLDGYNILMYYKSCREHLMKKKVSLFCNNVLCFFVSKNSDDKNEKKDSRDQKTTNSLSYNLSNINRMSIDNQTIKNTVKIIHDKWLSLLEDDYEFLVTKWYELTQSSEVELARLINTMILYNEKQIANLKKYILKLKSYDYNVEYIVGIQDKLYNDIKANHMHKLLIFDIVN